MRSLKVVAFDCDGVMFDTRKSNQMYYNRILEHFGKPPLNPEQFAYVHMHTVEASLDFLFSDSMQRQAAEEYRREMNYHSLIPYMEIEPGLKSLLEKLRGFCKTAVATNRTDTMDRVLQDHGLVGCFDLVVSAADVSRPKPYPDPLLKVLEHFQADPEEVVYIGDSELDEQAARAAGMPFVAYNNPRLSAAYHITRLMEVMDIFF